MLSKKPNPFHKFSCMILKRNQVGSLINGKNFLYAFVIIKKIKYFTLGFDELTNYRVKGPDQKT